MPQRRRAHPRPKRQLPERPSTAVRTLSIVMPVYNEAATVSTILDRIDRVRLIRGIRKEVVLVDDRSTDGTPEVLERYISAHPGRGLRLVRQDRNAGKGAALRAGFQHATGEVVIVQDADLEYDPEEYNSMLSLIVEDVADVVYGSRFVGGRAHRVIFFWHTIGNKFITFLSNAFTNLNLTDVETCYKMFRSDIIKSLPLKENRFGFEPEVTARIARIPGVRIYEVGISYYGRTFREGKKINWRDGVSTLWCILKYNLFVR